MKVSFVPLAVALAALVAVVPSRGDDPDPKKSDDKFKITPKRADDVVEVTLEKDRTVFGVKSPFGISQAVIERTEDRWPKAVVLRLHLKGLEHFRASHGKITLDAVASIQEGKPKARLWKDGKEEAVLDKTDPHWMDLRILGKDGKPAQEIPLKDGYFEMTLPQAFLDSNPRSITLNWIDFYR